MGINRPSLFGRLFGAVALVLAAGAVLLIWLARDYAGKAADEAYDSLLAGAATQIAESVRQGEGEILTDIPVSALDLLSVFRRERVYYRVITANGETLTGYDDLPVDDDILSLLARNEAGNQEQVHVWNTTFKDRPVRLAAIRHRLVLAGAPGHVVIVVGHTTDSRIALADRLTLQVSLVIGVMSVLALAGSAMAAAYALRPLKRVGQALNRRDPNDLAPLTVDTPREIEELVGSINRFMGRLSGRLDAIQQLIAVAAHQIRTPVAALASQLELMRNETRPEQARKQLERAQARANQLGRLANQLLAQAAVAHRAEAVKAVTFDLSEVVRQAAADSIPAGLNRDITVVAEGLEAACPVSGDPLSIGEAIRNILDNAVRHGAHARMRINLVQQGMRAVLCVADDGPGISPFLHEEVTKRFVRGSSNEEGSGLGLAIVAEVAARHEGRLAFGKDGDGYFCVTLDLPLKKDNR